MLPGIPGENTPMAELLKRNLGLPDSATMDDVTQMLRDESAQSVAPSAEAASQFQQYVNQFYPDGKLPANLVPVQEAINQGYGLNDYAIGELLIGDIRRPDSPAKAAYQARSDEAFGRFGPNAGAVLLGETPPGVDITGYSSGMQAAGEAMARQGLPPYFANQVFGNEEFRSAAPELYTPTSNGPFGLGAFGAGLLSIGSIIGAPQLGRTLGGAENFLNNLGTSNAVSGIGNAVPGFSTGVTTPTGGGIVGHGLLNPAPIGIAGGAPLGASPLAVAGGATALPGVTALPLGQLPGTNINVGIPPADDPLSSLLAKGVRTVGTNLLSSALAPGAPEGGGRMPISVGGSPSPQAPYIPQGAPPPPGLPTYFGFNAAPWGLLS